MNQYVNFARELEACIPPQNILIDEPLKYHTNFKLGGPADIMALPDTQEQLECILAMAKAKHIPAFVIGNGSNLVVRDGGIRGLVIKLLNLEAVRVEGDSIIAEAGVELKKLSETAFEHSLTGLEFACGIPGSLGGAVFMNAGAYEGEMAQVLESVTIITPQGEKKVLLKDEMELGYRTSVIKTKGHIVLEATMKLMPGDKEMIKERIAELTKRREERQPLDYPSAGSTFKRPAGYFAGKLIQDAGLRGYELGGAAVSEKHCGFIINKQGASARAVLELISHVQHVVLEKMEVQMETEILIVGEDPTTNL